MVCLPDGGPFPQLNETELSRSRWSWRAVRPESSHLGLVMRPGECVRFLIRGDHLLFLICRVRPDAPRKPLGCQRINWGSPRPPPEAARRNFDGARQVFVRRLS